MQVLNSAFFCFRENGAQVVNETSRIQFLWFSLAVTVLGLRSFDVKST